MHIGMVVFGDLSSDFRVFREASALRQAGHSVTVVASDRRHGGQEQALADTWSAFDVRLIPVEASASLRLAYPLFWRRAASVLKQIPADVYHAHDLDSLWPAVRAATHRRVPLVYDSHELWTGQSSLVARPAVRTFWSRLERHLVRRADRVITVSPSVATQLSTQYSLGDITVVRNLPPYRAPVSGDRIRSQLQLNDDCVILLYQGGFLTDNGLAEQIEAMKLVDGAVLVLIGSGPTEAALRAQVLRGGLEERVHFIPRLPFPDLHEYTCSADVGLCLIKPTGLSFLYSLPNKLFEYMMAALPVLGCDSPEIRRVIDDTGAGEVVDAANVAAIGRCLRRLVAEPQLRSQYADAARAAAPSLCWEREAAVLVELYDGLSVAAKSC